MIQKSGSHESTFTDDDSWRRCLSGDGSIVRGDFLALPVQICIHCHLHSITLVGNRISKNRRDVWNDRKTDFYCHLSNGYICMFWIKFDERISKVDLFIHFLDEFCTVLSIVPSGRIYGIPKQDRFVKKNSKASFSKVAVQFLINFAYLFLVRHDWLGNDNYDSHFSHIWTVPWRCLYLNVSFTKWRDEATNLVRIKTGPAHFICVFSNWKYFVG